LKIDFPGNRFSIGVHYMVEGIRLLWHPRLRKYILVPLLVNCIIFFTLTFFLFGYIIAIAKGGEAYISELVDSLPAVIEYPIKVALGIFKWLAWIIGGALFLIIYGYSFNVITNFIAAPFYGFLAAETEKIVTGQSPPDEPFGKMMARVFSREFSKLFYFFGRGLIILLLIILISLIPILNLLAPLLIPVISMLWSAWSMSIQYADYAADNHQVPFSDMRDCLWKRRRSCYGFGGCIMACSIIPIVNIFAMPAAVTGGTLYWLNEIKELSYSDTASTTDKA
jgi:CysZ protein